jgi:hypothetical protein
MFNFKIVKNNDNENDNLMELFGFSDFKEFSDKLDTDLAFRVWIFDFIKEHLVE